MNYHKKGMWFPITLIAFVVVIALWVPVKYGHAFLINYLLLHKGVLENAQVVKKGIIVDGGLVWLHNTQPSDNHQFQVRIAGAGIEESICQIGVSKSLYDNTPPGKSVPVKFLRDYPRTCKLSSSIPGTHSILLTGLWLSTFMLIFAFGTSFFLYRAYKKPGPEGLGRLTTNMELKGEVNCPKCGERMTEGYLPMGLGIHWRNIDQPAGLTTIFGGLPGTVFLFRRPRFHAYHCTKCKIVIFQYGRRKRR